MFICRLIVVLLFASPLTACVSNPSSHSGAGGTTRGGMVLDELKHFCTQSGGEIDNPMFGSDRFTCKRGDTKVSYSVNDDRDGVAVLERVIGDSGIVKRYNADGSLESNVADDAEATHNLKAEGRAGSRGLNNAARRCTQIGGVASQVPNRTIYRCSGRFPSATIEVTGTSSYIHYRVKYVTTSSSADQALFHLPYLLASPELRDVAVPLRGLEWADEAERRLRSRP